MHGLRGGLNCLVGLRHRAPRQTDICSHLDSEKCEPCSSSPQNLTSSSPPPPHASPYVVLSPIRSTEAANSSTVRPFVVVVDIFRKPDRLCMYR